MEKRGSFYIPLVFLLLVGFGLGYYSPFFLQNSIIDPLESSYYSNGWILLENERNYQAAVEEFKGYIKRNKTNYFAYEGLGWGYYNLQDYENAIKNFDKAIENAPCCEKHRDMHYGLGLTYFLLNNLVEAKENFYKAESFPLTNIEFYIQASKGWLQYRLEDYQGAIEAFSASIELNPDYVVPYMGLTLVYYETNDLQKADEAAEKFKENMQYSFPKNYRAYEAFLGCMTDLEFNAKNIHECSQLMYT